MTGTRAWAEPDEGEVSPLRLVIRGLVDLDEWLTELEDSGNWKITRSSFSPVSTVGLPVSTWYHSIWDCDERVDDLENSGKAQEDGVVSTIPLVLVSPVSPVSMIVGSITYTHAYTHVWRGFFGPGYQSGDTGPTGGGKR